MKGILLILLVSWSIPGQAQSAAEEFWYAPTSDFATRKQMFLEYNVEHGVNGGLYGIFTQIARMELGEQVDEKEVRETVKVIRSNRDCNDFTLNGLLRLVYLNREKQVLSAPLLKEIEACILDFKYWWDDGRKDTTYRCYHTENHQALYHTAEILAGQLFKDKVFTNGMNGRQHIEHALKLAERWLDYRFRFGFSEWMSTYYEVDILQLANLYDYAEEESIRTKAGMILDLLMFDLALNNYKGTIGSSSGRMYWSSLISGAHGLSSLMKLVFGVGVYQQAGAIAPVIMSVTSYRCPSVICEIGVDYKRPSLNLQRSSLEVDDAPLYGLSYDNELDCHLFWGMQEFVHPKSVRMSKQISEKYDTWPYRNYNDYIRKYEDQERKYGKIVNNRLDRFALSEANVMTWRTPDYMLSSVQDYRRGAPGYQQHVWQATLGNEALVFTNHPGSRNLRVSPNYWAGNSVLPRAAQWQNVLVCVYNIPGHEKNGFSHAYFPVDAFDEVRESGKWVFGRKGEGYIALYSQCPVQWKTDKEGRKNDLVAPGRRNVWICEMGDAGKWKSFERFIRAVSEAEITEEELQVKYTSPSAGEIAFGWETPFRVKGKQQNLRFDYRYLNPYCECPFNSRRIEIKKGKAALTLDFEKGVRSRK